MKSLLLFLAVAAAAFAIPGASASICDGVCQGVSTIGGNPLCFCFDVDFACPGSVTTIAGFSGTCAQAGAAGKLANAGCTC